MAFTESVLAILGFFGNQILQWLYLFYIPFTELNIIWILVPIYLNWIVTEIWLEKRFTSYGNAISNGVIVLWVGIDWGRQITNTIVKGANYDLVLFIKMLLTLAILAYGIVIIIYGIKARRFIHYLGRVRVVTYFMLMFTPIMYGLVPADTWTFLRIFLFLPLFYFVIEIIDKITPDPRTYQEDEGSGDFSTGLPNLPMDNFNELPPMDNFPPKMPPRR